MANIDSLMNDLDTGTDLKFDNLDKPNDKEEGP
jgi:hypothetical protein